MDVFKLRPEDQGFLPISKDSFEHETLRKAPWYQRNGRGEEVQYAVCPACDNPIQIIGLYRLSKQVDQPFGRHTIHGVPGLVSLNPEERENCPYFRPRPRVKTDRRPQMSLVSHKILDLLVTQFDRVMYLLRKQTGINFSQNLAQKMLLAYRAERGYLYTGATLMNVPWIFAYMSDSQSLFGQYVADNPDLARAIRETMPDAEITSDGRIQSRNKKFLPIHVSFIHHRLKKDREDYGLEETMQMVVATDEPGSIIPHPIFRQTIRFDYEEFQRLIAIPDGQGKRRMDHVDLAMGILGDLLP